MSGRSVDPALHLLWSISGVARVASGLCCELDRPAGGAVFWSPQPRDNIAMPSIRPDLTQRDYQDAARLGAPFKIVDGEVSPFCLEVAHDAECASTALYCTGLLPGSAWGPPAGGSATSTNRYYPSPARRRSPSTLTRRRRGRSSR
jgi:hypothetical protein